MSLIPRLAGSAALPTLRLAVLGVLATLALAGVFAAVKALLGDDDEDATPPGVVAAVVELKAGFTRPGDGTPTVGRVLDVPDDAETFILTARPGERYALRSRSGDDWHSWTSLEVSPHEAPNRPATAGLPGAPGSRPSSASSEGTAPELLATGPLLVDGDVTQLELVRLTDHDGGTVGTTFLLDSYGVDGLAPEPDTAVVAGTQVERGTAAGSTAPSGHPAQPAVMPRASWTSEEWASGNAGCEDGPRYADNVQALVVHHTVTGNDYDPDEVDNLLRSIHYSHVHLSGWCDIGYNFVIDRFGTIWEARSGGIDRPVVGGHARGFNTSTAGVALLGQHHPGASPQVARPSSEAAAAVQALAAWKLGLHGVDPAGTTRLRNRSRSGSQKLEGGSWHLVPTVLAHRDLGFTSCPGDYVVDLLDAATVSPATPDDFLASDPGRYIAALLEIFWGRPGTEAEITEWGRQLDNSVGRLGVTLALAQSDQWAGAKLDALYDDVLGRAPNPDGRRYWLDQIRDGLPLAAVGAFLYGSDEYYRASPSASHYVTRLYAALLGREPEPDGLDYWTESIESGQARPLDVAAGFYASVESRHQRVRDVYQAVLGREPDPAGLTFWTDELLRSDDVMLAAHLAVSDELYQRVISG